MKILVANKFYWPKGGSERVLFELNRGYEARGHEVVPFAMKSGRNLPTPWESHFVSEIDYDAPAGLAEKAALGMRTLYSREAKEKMRALVRAVRPDVAHLHNIHHQLSLSIVDALREEGVPAVQTLHDAKSVCPSYLLYTKGSVCNRCHHGRYWQAVRHRCVKGSVIASGLAAGEMLFHEARRTLARGVNIAVAPSHFLKQKIAEMGKDVSRIRVIPNGVDISTLSPAKGAGEGFIVAGRLSPEKGLKTLFRAIGLLPDVRLTVAGEGPQEMELRALAEDLAPGRIRFVGTLNQAELGEALRRARALVLPSECYENAPMIALEALGCSVPVIGSNLGGIPEIVRPGQGGALFEAGNVESLVEVMRKFQDNADMAEALGRSGRALVQEEYSLDRHISRMLEVLEEASACASR